MPLVTTTEMFKKAYSGGYAVGAFNVNNMEIIQGITDAAGELKGAEYTLIRIVSIFHSGLLSSEGLLLRVI